MVIVQNVDVGYDELSAALSGTCTTHICADLGTTRRAARAMPVSDRTLAGY